MRLDTDRHHTETSKFSYSAKTDFPYGVCGSHFKNGRYVTISETKRRRAIIAESIYRFSKKKYCGINQVIVSIIWMVFLKNGGHFQIRLSQKLIGVEPSILTL